MFTPVQGVRAAAPTAGLVAAARAEALYNPPDERWADGLAWVPERCGAGWELVPWCGDGDPVVGAPSRQQAVYHRPVGSRVYDTCSTFLRDESALVDRLERIADATAPFVIARELWTGSLSSQDTYTVDGQPNSNGMLASPSATVAGSGALSTAVALGQLEQVALQASNGQQVWIHVPPVLAPGLKDMVRHTSGMVLTYAGNAIVIDGGYPGTGPAGQPVGATAWMYATAPVQVRRSEIRAITDPSETIDRSTNTREVWADFVFAATFDPCVHVAAQTTIGS